jgi:hypothetical protein
MPTRRSSWPTKPLSRRPRRSRPRLGKSLPQFAVGSSRLAAIRQVLADVPPFVCVGFTGIPRISKLMALAICFEELIRDGEVANQSELATLAQVTQPRMTQILNLRHLAPDIQEALLFLPRVTSGEGGDPREAAASDRGGNRLGEAAGDVGGAGTGVRGATAPTSRLVAS